MIRPALVIFISYPIQLRFFLCFFESFFKYSFSFYDFLKPSFELGRDSFVSFPQFFPDILGNFAVNITGEFSGEEVDFIANLGVP